MESFRWLPGLNHGIDFGFALVSNLQDTVALQPSTFGQPVHDVLIRELNKKYANRVLHDVGLCVTVFDLTKCSEGKVRYGDGCLWHKGRTHTWPPYS